MSSPLIAALVPAMAIAAVVASVIDATKLVADNHTTWTTLDIARKYRPDNTGRLRRPRSQRNFAAGWKKKKQQHEFIDSIFHHFPIGNIILNTVYDTPTDTDAWYDIYDGRHRIETIWRFVNNEFRYNGVKYKDLSTADRKAFNERKVPVTEITFDSDTPVERQRYILAEVFIRLNKGIKLTDSDLCWANRDMAMIAATLDMLDEYEHRIRAVFGGCDVHARSDLSNWVALVIGISTRSAANMTTSYLRIAELAATPPDLPAIRSGLDALLSLYERANAESPVSSKDMKAYRKIGFVNAFFIADLISAGQGRHRDVVVNKWLDIITRLRTATTSGGMLSALKTKGAQNLNIAKVTEVLEQVNTYLATGAAPVPALPESDDDEEESDDA